MEWVDVIAVALIAAKILLMVTAVIFFVSGLDDLFIDLWYVVRTFYRRCFVLPRCQPLTEARLVAAAEQPIAILIPAWDESAVIRAMLLNLVRTLNYTNYHVFVGTYPNDPATHLEVEKVREVDERVHRIVTPSPGPTCKADCLNWIYQGIRIFEQDQGVRFEIFVMQDCEDVIHPLAYKMFNYLIPRKDMVQLPVLSLEREWYKFTGGHYLDEFAQLHYKDLVVRESLDHSIPAAGVGCAFSRRAFERVAASNRNQLFSIDSLTEDYDFGFRLKQHGLKQVFAKFSVVRTTLRRHWLTGTTREVTYRDVVCIREFFPDTYRAAVRQKSRWVVGITLQGWRNLGWLGDIGTKYMLVRDRKALATNLFNVIGYLIAIIVVALWFVNWLDPESYRYPPLLEQGTWLWYVIIANAGLLVIRVFQRAYCVQRLYNWQQAFLSVPRMAWGNLINFMATARAIKLYLRFLRTGKFIAWDKTSHTFPSEKDLRGMRRRLGDLLLERRLVTASDLGQALSVQAQKPALLGAILTQMGVVREEDLNQVLQAQ